MKELETANWDATNFNELGFWSADLDSGELDLCDNAKRKLGLQSRTSVNIASAFRNLLTPDRRAILRQIKNASPLNSQFQHLLTKSPNYSNVIALKGHFKFNDLGKPISLSGIITETDIPVKKESLKSDLLAIVSHELKAPLTTIKLYVQLAAKMSGKVRSAPLTRYLNAAVREVDLMDNLMENFLDYSSISTGKIPLYPRQFNLASVVREEFLRQQDINHTHIFELSDSKPVTVIADLTKIQLVINNLINNAVKYAPAQTVIRLSCTSINDSAVVCIEDQGPGISMED
jgi:two-component system sensor histidine kinase VicK